MAPTVMQVRTRQAWGRLMRLFLGGFLTKAQLDQLCMMQEGAFRLAGEVTLEMVEQLEAWAERNERERDRVLAEKQAAEATPA